MSSGNRVDYASERKKMECLDMRVEYWENGNGLYRVTSTSMNNGQPVDIMDVGGPDNISRYHLRENIC